jgi:hypothetical protein
MADRMEGGKTPVMPVMVKRGEKLITIPPVAMTETILRKLGLVVSAQCEMRLGILCGDLLRVYWCARTEEGIDGAQGLVAVSKPALCDDGEEL